MGSSTARRSKRKLKNGAAGGGEHISAPIRAAFKRVDKGFNEISEVSRSNHQAVQQAFYVNDIWFETMRMIQRDVVDTLVLLCDNAGIEPEVRRGVDGSVDYESYFKDANMKIAEQIKAQQASKDAEVEKPTIAAPDDETPVVFGGDYGDGSGQAATG